jgi:hypothetical protein
MLGMIRLLRIFQQYTRLQLGPILFPDPGEFQFFFCLRSSIAHVVLEK